MTSDLIYVFNINLDSNPSNQPQMQGGTGKMEVPPQLPQYQRPSMQAMNLPGMMPPNSQFQQPFQNPQMHSKMQPVNLTLQTMSPPKQQNGPLQQMPPPQPQKQFQYSTMEQMDPPKQMPPPQPQKQFQQMPPPQPQNQFQYSTMEQMDPPKQMPPPQPQKQFQYSTMEQMDPPKQLAPQQQMLPPPTPNRFPPVQQMGHMPQVQLQPMPSMQSLGSFWPPSMQSLGFPTRPMSLQMLPPQYPVMETTVDKPPVEFADKADDTDIGFNGTKQPRMKSNNNEEAYPFGRPSDSALVEICVTPFTQLDQIFISNNSTCSKHVEFIADFLKCQIGIYEHGDLAKFGKWEIGSYPVTLILSFVDGFYSVVQDL
uniref:Uncharacterized protein n=1 Tax=Panagrolaimus davidi TaxID=227884 RepID=A0A914QG67_9BILA